MLKIFGMGGFELVIILVVILLIFGPKNLPKLGNALGKTVSNLRSGMNEGKKKKEEAEPEDSAEAEQPAATKPAELEGEVMGVIEDAELASEPIEAAQSEQVVEPEAPSEQQAKKVRRVVKKKADAE